MPKYSTNITQKNPAGKAGFNLFRYALICVHSSIPAATLAHSDFLKKVPQVLGGDAGKFSSVYLGGNGQERPCYKFPKREACLMARHGAACRAVAEAKSIDEVKEFRDKAEAMRAYAKQAKNHQLEIDASEIRIRAERRIGELMASQRDAGLLNSGNPNLSNGSQPDPLAKPVTLAEASIDKNLADRAHQMSGYREPHAAISHAAGALEVVSAPLLGPATGCKREACLMAMSYSYDLQAKVFIFVKNS